MRDPYEVLGVSPDATEREIKRAYWRLCLESHPDRHPNDPEARERFEEATQAFEAATRARSGGELPEWAEQLVQRWRSVREAFARGDLQTAHKELEALIAYGIGLGLGVVAKGIEIKDSVTSTANLVRSGWTGLRSLFGFKKRKRKK